MPPDRTGQRDNITDKGVVYAALTSVDDPGCRRVVQADRPEPLHGHVATGDGRRRVRGRRVGASGPVAAVRRQHDRGYEGEQEPARVHDGGGGHPSIKERATVVNAVAVGGSRSTGTRVIMREVGDGKRGALIVSGDGIRSTTQWLLF